MADGGDIAGGTRYSAADRTAVADLWRRGFSAREIGVRIGRSVTSVSSFVAANRALCPGRGSGARNALQAVSPAINRDPIDAQAAARLEARMARAAAVVAEPRALRLAELSHGDCRWPLGGPGGEQQLFCGHEAARGRYCAGHARLAYRAG